ncbi:hypothetical protein ACSTI9_00500, partial [Vibrio parahaemolyticus]
RLGVRGQAAAGAALVREKGCVSCHIGLGQTLPGEVPIRAADRKPGCTAGSGTPHYALDAAAQKAIAAYQEIAGRDRYPSPVEERRR